MRIVLLLLLSASAWAADPPSPCKLKFSVMSRDPLNNVYTRLNQKDMKWLGKLEQKYPGVCYSDSGPALVLFSLWSLPAVHHGTRIDESTVPVSGTVTDSDGNVSRLSGTTTSSYAVPEEVHYRQLVLSVVSLEKKNDDGTFRIMHNFGGATLHTEYFGFCVNNCNPYKKLFESAMRWLYAGGLNDTAQSASSPLR